MLAVGVKTAHAQQVNIDIAIRSTAERLSASIGRGATVTVLTMQTDSPRMSDYLINETINALTVLQGGQGFTTVNRAEFDLRMGGLHVNMIINDATIRAAGGILDARYVIIGTFEPLAGFFRFRTQIIQVATAAVRDIHTVDVQNDGLVAYLMGGTVPASTARPVRTEAGQFTIGQRWTTLVLNYIPGLGSFVIMGDTFGGMFQIVCAGLGIAAMIASNTFLAERVPVSSVWGGHRVYYYRTNRLVWFAGWGLVATWQIYNIVRSFTFGRDTPATVAIIPTEWDIALVSRKDGIKGVTLSHVIRF